MRFCVFSSATTPGSSLGSNSEKAVLSSSLEARNAATAKSSSVEAKIKPACRETKRQ